MLLHSRDLKDNANKPVMGVFHKLTNENPNLVIVQASIPRFWLDESAKLLYFRVEDVESYAWTPRTPKSVEKRRRYARLKFGFLEREGRRKF